MEWLQLPPWQEKERHIISHWPVLSCHACVSVVIDGALCKVCTVYSISFSSTQRLGGHIPQALEAHNKSKTQTTQSLTRSIPSLSSLCHSKYTRRLGSLDIDFAWSCACIPFHLPRPLHAPSSRPYNSWKKRGTRHFPPRPPLHRSSATSTQAIV